MKIILTEGELVRLVKRIMNENYFDNNFYIKNIKSICKGIIENIENYKKILKKMPKSFRSKYIREDYFNNFLDSIYSISSDISRLNSNLQSLFGVSYNLSDYLNESRNWDFLQKESNQFTEDADSIKEFILGLVNMFETSELNEIEKSVKSICGKLVNYSIKVDNYYDFIRLNQNIIDIKP